MKYLCGVFLTTTLTAIALAACTRDRGASLADDAASPRSFEEHQIRYLAPIDLLQTMSRALPSETGSLPVDCRELTENNSGLVGVSSAGTGSPIFSQPSADFVRWYVGCVNVRLLYMNEILRPALVSVIYGTTVGRLVTSNPALANLPFETLDAVTRKAMVREQIERMIGPEEIVADFGYFRSGDEMADWVLKTMAGEALTVRMGCQRAMFLISIRDEFLSY